MGLRPAFLNRTGRDIKHSEIRKGLNMIRKSIMAAVLFVALAGTVWAQRPQIDLNFYADYVWTSSLSATVPDAQGNLVSGDFDIKSNPAFGLAIDVEVRPGTQVELLYQRQDSETEFKSSGFSGTSQSGQDIATSYYHVGALQGFRRGKWLPFTGLTLGATSFDPQGGGMSTEWKFSFGFQAGAKVYLNDRIGLRFHGRLFSSLLESSGGLYFGTGGLGLTVGGSALWQWTLGGGIVVTL
jgi:hypothetical protein